MDQLLDPQLCKPSTHSITPMIPIYSSCVLCASRPFLPKTGSGTLAHGEATPNPSDLWFRLASLANREHGVGHTNGISEVRGLVSVPAAVSCVLPAHAPCL